MRIIVLLLSILMGLSFLVGSFLSKRFKGKQMTYFSVSLAFVIFAAVLLTDIVPEINELTKSYTDFCLVICGALVGMTSLFLIDLFIPHHHHEHVHNDENKNEHKKHLYHIGVLTLISVIMHNIFEGIAFYTIAGSSFKAALAVTGGIALHNIPLGIEISSFFRNNKEKYIKRNIALVFSGTLGALIGLLLGEISATFNLIILSITCGMMLYTGIIELGTETFKDIKEKGVIEGLFVGGIIFALMLI